MGMSPPKAMARCRTETLYSAFVDHFPCTDDGSMSSYDENAGVRIMRIGAKERTSWGSVEVSRRYVILQRLQPLKVSS